MIGSQAFLQALARLAFHRDRLRQKGYLWLVMTVLKRASIVIAWAALLPVTLVLHAAGFRRVAVFLDRIGHLAADVDCFLKERALGRLPERRWFILAPPSRIANKSLLSYWRTKLTVVSSPLACALLNAMTWKHFMVFDVDHYLLKENATAAYCEVSAAWGDRGPLVRLTEEHAARGRRALESMGVPKSAWFVCFHAREGGFSPADEIIHSYRNSDVLNLIPAMKMVVAQGGWCVRMGDATMKPLPSLDRIIDYAHHAGSSDWMDIFLCASCRFFVGNSSGLHLVSSAFGVPSVLANMMPLSALAHHPMDISIPKLLRRIGAKDYLHFPNAFSSAMANYRYASFYRDAGVEVEENSAEDIRDLVSEMLERLEGRFSETDEDRELQCRYKALFKPGHYSYGAASRVGLAFLRKYRYLLD